MFFLFNEIEKESHFSGDEALELSSVPSQKHFPVKYAKNSGEIRSDHS